MAGMLKLSVVMAIVGGLVGVVAAGEPLQTETLTIGAAHTLKPAFREIVPMFEKEYGAQVRVVYGPSQTLRRQIEQGAAIDVFLPAAVEEVEKLHKKGLTLKGRPRIYTQTSLVLIMSATSRATPIAFHEVLPNQATRLTVADPEVSALGAITDLALKKLDPAYKNHFQLVHAQHSEDIVNLVHTGQAHVGFVYRADAINNGQVRIIDETPTGSYAPIQLGEAMVWTCRKVALGVAEDFLDFMISPRIQKLLLKYGFDSASSNG